MFQLRSSLHWSSIASKQALMQISAKDAAPVGGLDDDKISFNGHTVQINPSVSPVINYEGKNYQLLQFHFHTPSENRIDGHASASEMHIVHKASDGSLLVIAACCPTPPPVSLTRHPRFLP